MPDADIEVLVARLEGRLDTIQQTLALRLDQTSIDAQAAKQAAKQAHRRLDDEGQALRDRMDRDIGELHELVQDLRRWRARLAGVGVGIGAMSGLVSGLIVLLLSQAS